jgi:gluconolactonase
MKILSALLPAAALLVATATATASEFHLDQAAEFARLVPAGAKVAKLAGDMGFIEGPVWVKADGGYLVFSDIPNNELKRWSAAGGLATFRKPSQNANGNTLDLAGRLITCEHSGRRVAVLEKSGELKTVVDSFDGKKLNSPNDAVVKSDGTIWFTDPEYGLRNDPATKQRIGKEQAANHVFRHDPKTGKTTAVVRDFVQPNGLAFSPDEKTLYVADSGAPRHIRAFAVAADGTLGAGRVFCTLDKGAPDGLRVDRDGRVWTSAGDGVQIFAANGERIGKILTPEAPANLCFGGADGKTLFITARKSLYAIPVLVTGAGR